MHHLEWAEYKPLNAVHCIVCKSVYECPYNWHYNFFWCHKVLC